MPIQTTYPGIYIEELPSSTHTITAAPTSIAVFVGYTHPFKTQQFNKPIELFSFTDYERYFGGFFRNAYFDAEAALFGDVAQAVNQFFLNGGGQAWVIGLLSGNAAAAQLNLAVNEWGASAAPPANFAFSAPFSSPNLFVPVGPLTFFPLELSDANHQMQVTVANVSKAGDLADVTITYGPPASSPLAGYGNVAESYRQVSAYPYLTSGATPTPSPTAGTAAKPNKPNPNYILTRINGVSSLVKVAISSPGAAFQPTSTTTLSLFPATITGTPWQGFSWAPASSTLSLQTGSAGDSPLIFDVTDFTAVFQQDSPLDKLPIFNLMVIPGVTNSPAGSILPTAAAFCEKKRAFLIMDPPIDNSADGSIDYYSTGPILIEDSMAGATTNETIPQSVNSALYFPYLTTNDPVTGLAVNPISGKPYEIPPGGTVAGIYASTDVSRGCWKAPAGLATTLTNVNDVVERGKMTDQRQGVLNPLGINCIRNFPATGPVVWGARTSVAANPAYQQWMYVPVRRMALFLEQTLYMNLGWVVFEPNAPPLWTSIVTNIESFMLGLYRQGAFQGTTPSQAFQVKCDRSTTTPDDIDNGIVNILVAFAPLKPAEFVVIQIAQLAGQAQSS